MIMYFDPLKMRIEPRPGMSETSRLAQVGVMSGTPSKRYPAELKARSVQMVAEAVENGESEWSAMRRIAELLGVGSGETGRKWVVQAQADTGPRAGVSTEEALDE
jgi:transposase